jgi:hypothetical protein
MPGGAEENHEETVIIVGVATQFLTEHLSNISRERYRCGSLLGNIWWRLQIMKHLITLIYFWLCYFLPLKFKTRHPCKNELFLI